MAGLLPLKMEQSIGFPSNMNDLPIYAIGVVALRTTIETVRFGLIAKAL